jgi:tripartite-type tricarboxylate transporter receptor subunit TctC
MTDLLAGTVSMALDTLSILLPPSRAGSLRALGVTTPQRSRLVPELPALAETLPGFDAAPFNYIAATGGTPAPIVARLNQAIVGILNDPAYRARMEALGEEATPSSPEELAATIAAESARWKQVIEAAGIRVE